MKLHSVTLENDGSISMDFHFRKEARCILPYWLLALGTILGIGMMPSQMAWMMRLVVPPTCAVLICMMGAASFGSEFQHRTMPLLLLQPLERAVLWRSKMIVLALALFSLVAAVWLMPANFYPERNYQYAVLLNAFFVFGMLPWLTLVTRDGLIGFGLSFAIACGQEAIAKALFDPYPVAFSRFEFVNIMLLGVIGLYFGRLAFMRWEFTPRERPRLAWLDSVFAPPTAVLLTQERKQTALGVLVRKELRLQIVSILFASLFCLGFVLIALLVRLLPDREPLLKHFVQVYCAMFPVVAGAVSVAGERQLGVLEWHLSLPVSVLRQFLVKMSVCLTLALGAGFLLPWSLLRLRGAVPEWFPASLFFLLVLIGATIGVCCSSFQTGTLRAAIIGLAGLFPVLVGGVWLRDVFIYRGVYIRFYSGPSWFCSRFCLCIVMMLVLAVLFRLAFGGYRNSTAVRRPTWVLLAIVIGVGALLAAGLLAVGPQTAQLSGED